MNSVIYFWGHTSKSGEKACFSNWYPSIFTEGDIKFYNTEQYMMYHKAKLFKDIKMMHLILKNPDPRTVKGYGRRVKNFNQLTWENERETIVFNGCLLKFQQNPSLQTFLLSTNNKLLVEASPYDKIWGIGLSEREARITPRAEWQGINLLGKCLMKVRDEL